MPRIWQQDDWPNFVWDRSALASLEARFLHESGRRIGAFRHLGDADRTGMRIEWLSDEALETSAIEGEILDRASVRSSIRRHFGLEPDRRAASPAEAGVAEMMVALYREFDRPLDHATLWSWHGTLMRERSRLEVIGGYRRHPEAMQIVSGPDHRRKIHYEAPPSDRMTTEMDRYILVRPRRRRPKQPACPDLGGYRAFLLRVHPSIRGRQWADRARTGGEGACPVARRTESDRAVEDDCPAPPGLL